MKMIFIACVILAGLCYGRAVDLALFGDANVFVLLVPICWLTAFSLQKSGTKSVAISN